MTVAGIATAPGTARIGAHSTGLRRGRREACSQTGQSAFQAQTSSFPERIRKSLQSHGHMLAEAQVTVTNSSATRWLNSFTSY